MKQFVRLFTAFLIIGLFANSVALADKFKCTAYCGRASVDTVGYTPKEKCSTYNTWGKQCGGDAIREINFKKLERFDIFSEIITSESVEKAYQVFVELCQRKTNKEAHYWGTGFIFRRFDNDRNAILPDVDDAFKSCAVMNKD